MAEMSKNLSGLTDQQAKEFHEHWKHGTWSWVMIASVVHVVTWVYQPWFLAYNLLGVFRCKYLIC